MGVDPSDDQRMRHCVERHSLHSGHQTYGVLLTSMRKSLVLRREVARLDNDIRKDWCSGSLENAIGYQQVARRL